MEQTPLSTQQNQTSLGKGKTLIQRGATILVLLSSILPFINNILKNFIDTESILLLDNPNTKKLDLDSAIFFFSMPVSYALIAFGGLLGAHKKSYYAVFLSCYFQIFLIIHFIFIKMNNYYLYTQACILIIFISIAVLYFKKKKYYKTLEEKNDFLNKTLDRYSSIIKGRK